MQTILSVGALSLTAVLLSSNAAAAMCEAKSTNTIVPLLELYTSEGCDSCPPADQWLAALGGNGIGRDRLVPLAFHVDYWDNLGWIDPFAQSIFTARQREFTRRAGASTVYTPEFVLNGREYRRWSTNDVHDQLRRTSQTAPRADIALALKRTAATLEVDGEAKLRDAKDRAGVYLALYENNLQSNVKAGENRGRTLRHDSVVRRLVGPLDFDREGKARLHQSFALGANWKVADVGVAAFVQEINGTAILQTLALGVCPSSAAK
jgi:hypothetical protein